MPKKGKKSPDGKLSFEQYVKAHKPEFILPNGTISYKKAMAAYHQYLKLPPYYELTKKEKRKAGRVGTYVPEGLNVAPAPLPTKNVLKKRRGAAYKQLGVQIKA